MKYIIMCCGEYKQFEIPRQLSIVEDEPIVKRTIRLLKQNGINDILITSHDKRFDHLDAKRYEPKFNDYNPEDPKSPWLKAFPIELMDEPTCYLFGDVYYSENAIKTIVEKDNNDILFFCTYNNKSRYYIKHHDEPLAFKVHNFDKFKYHINRLIEMWNNDETVRRPIAWELYRSINNQDVNIHTMTTNYIAINDESCDIDTNDDIIKLREMLGGKKMIKVEVTEHFTFGEFNKVEQTIVRKDPTHNEKGHLYTGDVFECDQITADYLTGNNAGKKTVVKIIEVVPEPKTEEEVKEEKPVTVEKKSTYKKKKKSK